jgi:hypothetical protein
LNLCDLTVEIPRHALTGRRNVVSMRGDQQVQRSSATGTADGVVLDLGDGDALTLTDLDTLAGLADDTILL